MVIDISKLTEKAPIDIDTDINTKINDKGLLNLQDSSQLSLKGKLSKQQDKKGDLYTFSLQISGLLVFLCDLCTSPVTHQVDFSIEEVVKKPVDIDKFDEDADVIWLTNTKLDIEPLLAVHMHDHLPMKVLCQDNCAGLCENCGANLNQGSCGCIEKETDTDPRFDMLKTLKFD